MKKLIAVIFISTFATISYASVKATASAECASGYRNTWIHLVGHHSVNITNTTTIRQKYKVYYQICSTYKDCYTVPKELDLDPGQNFNEKYNTTYDVHYGNPGHYQNNVRTDIEGPERIDMQDYSDITVY